LDIPVAMIPSMAMLMFALWKLLGGIKKLTGLEFDDIFKTPPEKAKSASGATTENPEKA
jgi:hypothetical protein